MKQDNTSKEDGSSATLDWRGKEGLPEMQTTLPDFSPAGPLCWKDRSERECYLPSFTRRTAMREISSSSSVGTTATLTRELAALM